MDQHFSNGVKDKISTVMDDSHDKKMLKSDQNKFCTLPDAVRLHILSFLDMKEVVATSLLSTRWRDLWASLPVLKFDDSLWKTRLKNDIVRPKRFMNFVDKVLLLRDGSTVTKFQITCSSGCDSDRIDAWLRVAGRRQFQKIHLELVVNEPKELPRLLFSSSITVLKLDGDMANFDGNPIQIPISVCSSPLLTTLVLYDLTLPESSSDGELVFSNPVLENLTLRDCNHSHLNVLNISTYRLKNLVFLKYNWESALTCQIKICTPNLTSIDFGGYWCHNCCLGDLSSLVSARFDFIFPKAADLVKVLECVSCPTTIKISECLKDEEELSGKFTRPYTNIRSLTFKIWGKRRGINRYLLNLLNICPCLETFYLEVYDVEDPEEQCVFPITFSHLKYVEIRWLMVHGNELKFLQFLLKNAIILEKLDIKMDITCDTVKSDFGVKIHSLTRASPSLTLVLL